MSRRKPAAEYEDFAIDIVCPRRHRLGMVIKRGPQHPRAGAYDTVDGVRFEDSPSPNPDSGRVRGTCSKCGSEVLLRWDRVRDRLDRNSEIGRNRDEFRG